VGNIILLRKSNTHRHDRVGRQLSSFRVRNVLYLPIHNITTTTAQRKMFRKKKMIINKLVRVRKHIVIIILLRLENFLVGINLSVFDNQTAKHYKPVMCGVPMYVIVFTHLYTAGTVLKLFQSTQTFVHFSRIKARNWFI